ncbi:hypothetical protein C0Q70_20207 [Pomacea canaliculata]|uniref:Rho guanine nucleotide exchange factor 28 n=1 Tax=Pomacea canaliculata TaxID=400727 RepID=A0A2T7NEX6_POMCA|nr:hypothetical protein C0Q70_20207 [Pomacea canaliculata]
MLEVSICYENILAVNEEDEMFLALEGSTQRHLVTMHYNGGRIWQAPIPEFLVNCVNNPHALDNLELIKSDQFDLANEVLSTLDERLKAALEHATYPEGWDLLGNDQSAGCRETLLHLVGRLGLHRTALFLLTKPGSQEALHVINHEGQQPCGVAADSGFYDIAELFAGYNTSGMKVENTAKALSTEYGLLHSCGSNSTSLTVSLDSDQTRTLEESLEMLRKMEAALKCGDRGFSRPYQTEWPSSFGQKTQQQQRFQSYFQEPEIGNQHEVEEALERILQLQKQHMNQIAYSDNILPDPSAEHSPDHYSYDVYPSSVGSSSSQSNFEQCLMHEETLSICHSMNEDLLWHRGSKQHRKIMEAQKSRKLHLARFSSSCPALDVHHHPCPLSPIQEWDQHRSMQDLAEDEKNICVAEGLLVVHGEDCHDQGWVGETPDGGVRICVNGITVDSSSDFPESLDDSNSVITKIAIGGVSQNMGMKEDESNRRRSWCPESLLVLGADVYGPSDNTSISLGRTIGMAGKSLSLSGLDREDVSEGEDTVDAANTSSSPPATPLQKWQHQSDTLFSSLDEDILPSMSADSRASDNYTPFQAVREDAITREKSLEQEITGTVVETLATGNTGLDNSKVIYMEKKRSVTDTHGIRSYEEGHSSLDIGLSPITKSLSTPSIPLATTLLAGSEGADKPILRDGCREGKLPAAASRLVEKHIEDDDAQFCRQEEIEEEEHSSRDTKEISWKEFLNEEQSTAETDEKLRQPEKKRKSNVLSRFSNSYLTKKNKEKESKIKQLHQFVAVSFSNAAVCDMCHKPMTNKPALRCENCLINVHEHGCKDQAASCDKYAAIKVMQREDLTAPLQRHLTQQASDLRHTHSFKHKDNRSTLMSSKGQNSVSGVQGLHRHSLPTSSKAINEESETDGGLHMQEASSTSNITETTSESLESLDTVGAEASFLDEEADLMLSFEEPEAWSITRLKKMNAKDIKRQDTIWELIQTEKQYVKKLKIMQRLFRDSLMAEQNFPGEQIQRMFPRLDDLLELHTTFLRKLLTLQTINADRSIDDIGPTLLEQFSKTTAEKMKSVYGVFCSKHTEAIQMYKEIAKNDRKFQNFCRKMSNQTVCEKRELPDFILGVTVRLSKYPILIEAILKGTKDKKDRELLSQALQCSKDVVHGVDEKVAAYEKLMEIYKALDSRTTVYRGKKFKRQDLFSETRQLVHAGTIGWKSARGRVLEVYAVVLSDLILFLQKNEQKYTFFLQDNKSCLVPLNKLLLREKGDARDSHGIYLISQDHNQPEMYELVCNSKEQRDQWMTVLRRAINECPKEEVIQRVQQITEEEQRRHAEKSKKMKEIIAQLHQKDDVIKKYCDEKNQLIRELMEMSVSEEDSLAHDQDQVEMREAVNSRSVEMVRAAMREVSNLTTILQGSGIALSRSASSVGEHVSTSFVNMPVPKRAETFAGFDAAHECGVNKKRFTQIGDYEGYPTSTQSLESMDTISEDKKLPISVTMDSVHSSLSPAAHFSSSPQGWEGQPHSEWTSHLPDRNSYHGSIGELSASSMSSLVQPLSSEQMMSVVQLEHYLNNLMNLTVKQCTTVECLRAELVEAKEEIRKLSADMRGRRQTGYGYDQLEELRNLQEKFSRERQEWEATKARERTALQREKENLEAERCFLQKKEVEIKRRKEELSRQHDLLKRHIDMLKEQGLLEASVFNEQPHHMVDLDTHKLPSHHHVSDPGIPHQSIGHRRSASADFSSMTSGFVERDSSSKLTSTNSNSSHDVCGLAHPYRMFSKPQTSRGGKAVPVHLLSTFNEHKVGGANVQQLPLKLSSSLATGNNRQRHPPPQHSQSLPPRITAASVAGPRGGSKSPSERIPSPAQAQGMILRNQKSRSTPSNLSSIIKLAEPANRMSPERVSHKSSSTDPAPGGPRTAPEGTREHGVGSPVFYF